MLKKSNNTRREFLKKLALAGVAVMSFSPGKIWANVHQASSKLNKAKEGLTFLFQGDSITDGNRTRNNDWNHLMGHGYAYLVASRLWYDYPDKNLTFYNRGVSGNRVIDLENRWQQDTLDLKPDVLSILVGINDVAAIVNNTHPYSIEKYEEIYNRLLKWTIAELPHIMLVLCEPFILPLGRVSEKTGIWQSQVQKTQKVVRKLADRYDAIFIELQKPFNEACRKSTASYWIWDGIHPMPAGHEMISRIWINEVKKKIVFIK